MLVADEMLGKGAEVFFHLFRLAEIGKASIKNDLLVQIQELTGILADIRVLCGL